LLVLNSNLTFKNGHGRESVARTALALILDRNDNIVTPEEFVAFREALVDILVIVVVVVVVIVVVVVVVVIIVVVIVVIVVIHATNDGALSKSSVLPDAHPPAVEFIFGPAFLCDLLLVLLLFLVLNVFLIFLVELLVKLFARPAHRHSFLPFLVVKFLVLLSAHFKPETIFVLLLHGK